MPETTDTPADDPRHSGLMAGLEIVDAESRPMGPPPPKPLPERSNRARPAEIGGRHALTPIQAMWNGSNAHRSRPGAAKPVVEKEPRRLYLVLPGLLVLAVLAAFVSWTSAAPLWLIMGRGVEGTVAVEACDYSGCHGVFRGADADSGAAVRVTGDTVAKTEGRDASARVTSLDAATAYVGDSAGLWWRLGFGLVALVGCGFAVAGVSGAWRWHGRARLAAVSASLAAPLALFAVVFTISG